MHPFLPRAITLALVCTAVGCQQNEQIPVASKSPRPNVVSATDRDKSSPDNIEGPSLTDVLLQAGEAVQSIDDDEEEGLRLEKATLLSALGVFQANAGNRAASAKAFREALELTDRLDDPRLKQFQLGVISLQQAEVGHVSSALETHALLGPSGHPALLYAYIAIWHAKQGHMDETDRYLQLVRDAYNQSIALMQIGQFQWRRGNQDAARESLQQASAVAGRIKDSFLKTNALADLVEVYVAIGDRNSPSELIDEALRIAENEPSMVLRQGALRPVARAQAACGDVEGILGTDAALRRAEFATKLQGAVSEVMRGHYKTAAGYMTSNRLSLLESPVLDDIVTAYSKSGDFESAMKIVRTMSDSNARNLSLSGIARDQIAAGKLAEAAETCAAIDEDLFRARTLSEIAAARMDAGDVDLALQLFHESRLAALSAVADATYSAHILGEIAATETKSGRLHASFMWASRQESILARAHALIGVAEGLQQRLQDARKATNTE